MSAGDDHLRTLRDLRVSLDQANKRCTEWHHLVEEAKGERDRLKSLLEFSAGLLKAKGTEIDRLKGELAEAREQVSDAHHRMGWIEIGMRNTEDALRKDLTEAERLIDLGIANSGLWPELRAQYRAFRAAPPAEKARVVSWKVELDEAEQAQPSVAHAKQVASQDAHASEQAQGEGALTLEMLDEVLRDHINDEYNRSTELAKRVGVLETWLREFKASANEPVPVPQVRLAMGYGAVGRELMKWKELAAPPPPEAAGPAGTFSPVPGDTNSPWCQHCGLHISRHRAPTATTGVLCPVALNAEAAGPGHRFICSSGFDDNCGPSCVCKECDHRLGGHAVPPIPEGTR
jgi:hypothetical protein